MKVRRAAPSRRVPKRGQLGSPRRGSRIRGWAGRTRQPAAGISTSQTYLADQCDQRPDVWIRAHSDAARLAGWSTSPVPFRAAVAALAGPAQPRPAAETRSCAITGAVWRTWAAAHRCCPSSPSDRRASERPERGLDERRASNPLVQLPERQDGPWSRVGLPRARSRSTKQSARRTIKVRLPWNERERGSLLP